MKQILIKGGRVVDPSICRDEQMDVLIEDGKIAKVAPDIISENAQIIDARGKAVMPGFIDLHVHLREPGFEYKETIATGTKAAAHGGVTTICPMPNTNPAIDTPQRVADLLRRSENAPVHVLAVGAVTLGQEGKELADIAGMKNAGAVAISEDGKSVMDTLVYRKGLEEAAKAGIPVFAHCEDKKLVDGGVMNAGKKAEELGLPGITNAVEDVIVARDILMSKEAKNQLHLCHCSTADSAVLIEMAKKQGLPVTGEVCPHHFTMCDEDITHDHGNFKMNPPLRSKEDVEALKKALKEGIIDVISTDHAPHGEEEKDCSMKQAPFGIVGIENSFALGYTELVKGGYLSLSGLVEKMSLNPAKVLGIDKGTLKEGSMADVVVAELDTEYTIDKNQFYSKGKNTPFHGKHVYGRIDVTITDGKIVYERTEESM